MFGGVRLGGLGSGLDTQKLINALMDASRVPIKRIEAKKDLANKRIELVGNLEGLVKDLRTSAKKLQNGGDTGLRVVNSDPDRATITATTNESAGAHTLVVNQLATTDEHAFNSVVSKSANLGTANGQTVEYSYKGQTYSFSFNSNTSKLTDIEAAINAGPNGGVTAHIVQNGPGDYQLHLKAGETGEAARLSGITSTVTGLTINYSAPDALGQPTSANHVVVGNDAEIELDGQTYTSSDNVFDDVLAGVSITALQADPSKTINFSIGQNTVTRGQVEGFVDAYNKVVEFINEQSSYDPVKGTGGALFGDSTLRRVEGTLRRTLFAQQQPEIDADTIGFGTLHMVGIELQNNGTLEINDAVLDAKMAEDITAFTDLFVDADGFDNGGATEGTAAYYVDQTADTGLGDDLMRALDSLIDDFRAASGSTHKGLFTGRQGALEESIQSFDRSIELRERQLAKVEEQLVKRFAALDSMMGQLGAQQAFLGQTLLSSQMQFISR